MENTNLRTGTVDWTQISSVASGFGTIVAGLALLYSMTSFQHSLRIAHYTEIDKMYQQLLEIAMSNVFVLTPAARMSRVQRQKYNVYAFMMWNFLEAVHDRCSSDKDLWRTWHPVLLSESRLHFRWIGLEENRRNFKSSFTDYAISQVEPKTA